MTNSFLSFNNNNKNPHKKLEFSLHNLKGEKNMLFILEILLWYIKNRCSNYKH